MNENDKQVVILQMKLLYNIGNDEGFMLSGKPNKKAREIVKILNEMGGLELMQHASQQVIGLLQKRQGTEMGRELEHCWNWIDDWIA